MLPVSHSSISQGDEFHTEKRLQPSQCGNPAHRSNPAHNSNPNFDWVEVGLPRASTVQQPQMRVVSEQQLLDRDKIQEIHTLIRQDDYEGLASLVKMKGVAFLDVPDEAGMTALLVAITSNMLQNRDAIVSLLLQFKPNVDIRAQYGRNVLQTAISFGCNKSIITKLLDAGANPSQVDNFGQSAFDAARETQRDSIYSLLRDTSLSQD
jgi:hypothetical protein